MGRLIAGVARMGLILLDKLVKDTAQEAREREVFCADCGSIQEVDPGLCLRRGWPRCCNQTMRMGEKKK
jgi:hypothetical protein